MDDWELIDRYARHGSQEAFAELVSRHLNLVYSAARRQVRSPQLAEEVTQAVFLDLAREAPRLKPGSPLAAWLHVVTRRTALNTSRTEARRAAREQAAFELSAMNAVPSPWTQVEPLLDEAVEALPDPDRSAILLRYFENKSLREIGATLGTSEDAAQKRVSRALDQLRTLLAKRGVAVTAAGLATDLSAHAIEAAPLALGTTISAGSFLSTAGVAVVEATRTFAMTTIQKASVAAALALIIGTAWYEARALQLDGAEQQRRTAALQELQDRTELVRQKQVATQRQLASVRQEIARVKVGMATQVPIDAAMEKEMRAFLEQIQLLKQAFADNPQWIIPELELLTEQDWLQALQNQQPFTAAKMSQVLALVRTVAKGKVRTTLIRAWSAYLAEHDGAPATVRELEPYFELPISQELLARYDIRPAPRLGSLTSSLWFEEKPIPVDIEFDSYLVTAAVGGAGYYYNNLPALEYHARQAQEAYQRAHGGQPATDASQLLPYLPQAVDPAKLKRYLNPPGTP